MAFPLTHLCVAHRVIQQMDIIEPAQFLLGSVAPDAVHHRAEFKDAAMGNIGPTKKITHLCPVSKERWGQVTDNEGWLESVKHFLNNNQSNSFIWGYAAHVLTDLHNNITLWANFRTTYPQEAAKGYAGEFYDDLRSIDLRIAKAFFAGHSIEKLLQQATPTEMPGLIFADELYAMQHSLLNRYTTTELEQNNTSNCKFITYEQTLQFIEDAADFVIAILGETT